MALKGRSQNHFPASLPFCRRAYSKETHLSFSKDFRMSELCFCLKKKRKQEVSIKLSRTSYSPRADNDFASYVQKSSFRQTGNLVSAAELGTSNTHPP